MSSTHGRSRALRTLSISALRIHGSGFAGLGNHRLECAAHRVSADQTPQAQRLGRHRIASHTSDVRVAPTARQDVQHERAQHVALGTRVGAAVAQRAAFDPALEHAGCGQELGEEHQLPVWCGLCRLVPAHVHAPAHRLNHRI